MKSETINKTFAAVIEREARRLGDGRSGDASDLHLDNSPERCQAASEILSALMRENSDVNVRIGAASLVGMFASVFRRSLPGAHLRRLCLALIEASRDQACNDYAYESEVSELDVLRVCDEAQTALNCLNATQSSWSQGD